VIGRFRRTSRTDDTTRQERSSQGTPAAETPVNATTFLDPTTLARIGNLELLARTVVDGFINGLHRSPHLGTSMDFAEHRVYMPGDDTRRIDWRLYARTDRLYLKEFEADTVTSFSILLDISASMGYGSGAITKLDYGRFLAACLAYLAHGQRDRVGFMTFDSDIVDMLPPSGQPLLPLLHAMARARAERPGSLEAPLRKIAEQFRRRSMILLISDLYAEPEQVAASVRLLRQRGNDVMVVHILDQAELELPFDDATTFMDLELGERIPVSPNQMREQYRAAIQEHITELGKRLVTQGVDYAMFNTSQPLDHALFHFLNKRQQLMRVR
jgi:uncharacterized protein (DUF58 family)